MFFYKRKIKVDAVLFDHVNNLNRLHFYLAINISEIINHVIKRQITQYT